MEGFQKPPPKQLDLNAVKAVKILGKGALGTVFLAYDSAAAAVTPPSFFALKVVDKSAKPDAERRARWETAFLSSLKPHPFLPNLLAASSDSHDLVGWSVPYCSGGDLNVLRQRQMDRVFSPAVIRFYLAEIVCALDHLHASGVVYRDLKPENVLIQQSGHVTLTDFDLSRRLSRKSFGSDSDSFRQLAGGVNHQHCRPQKRNLNLMARLFPPGNSKSKPARVSPMNRRPVSFASGERSNSFVGTEEYVSPEMVRGEGHEFAVDWWALGVLGYEMLYGRTPFRGKTRKETFQNVLIKEPEFVGKRTALMDLIGRLLEKDPIKRLGFYGGAEEIRSHEFFKGLKWDLLTEVLRPPFVPPSTEEGETATAGAFDVTEYFKGLKVPKPPSGYPSMTPSMSSDHETDISLTEF